MVTTVDCKRILADARRVLAAASVRREEERTREPRQKLAAKVAPRLAANHCETQIRRELATKAAPKLAQNHCEIQIRRELAAKATPRLGANHCEIVVRRER